MALVQQISFRSSVRENAFGGTDAERLGEPVQGSGGTGVGGMPTVFSCVGEPTQDTGGTGVGGSASTGYLKLSKNPSR